MQRWRPAHLRSVGANFSRRRKNLLKNWPLLVTLAPAEIFFCSWAKKFFMTFRDAKMLFKLAGKWQHLHSFK
jgi:hypothetical protein